MSEPTRVSVQPEERRERLGSRSTDEFLDVWYVSPVPSSKDAGTGTALVLDAFTVAAIGYGIAHLGPSRGSYPLLRLLVACVAIAVGVALVSSLCVWIVRSTKDRRALHREMERWVRDDHRTEWRVGQRTVREFPGAYQWTMGSGEAVGVSGGEGAG
jgi:hypothetical protein